MMNETQSKEETVAAIEAAFGRFWGKQSVLNACTRAEYADHFPEDMIEERTSWDELKCMFDDMRDGFQALFDFVAELAEKENSANRTPASVIPAE